MLMPKLTAFKFYVKSQTACIDPSLNTNGPLWESVWTTMRTHTHTHTHTLPSKINFISIQLFYPHRLGTHVLTCADSLTWSKLVQGCISFQENRPQQSPSALASLKFWKHCLDISLVVREVKHDLRKQFHNVLCGRGQALSSPWK